MVSASSSLDRLALSSSIDGLRQQRVALAGRGTDNGGQWDDGVGSGNERAHQCLVTNVAAYEVEPIARAQMQQGRLSITEVVDCGHVVNGIQQML